MPLQAMGVGAPPAYRQAPVSRSFVGTDAYSIFGPGCLGRPGTRLVGYTLEYEAGSLWIVMDMAGSLWTVSIALPCSMLLSSHTEQQAALCPQPTHLAAAAPPDTTSPPNRLSLLESTL
jgi:hypothetical protein